MLKKEVSSFVVNAAGEFNFSIIKREVLKGWRRTKLLALLHPLLLLLLRLLLVHLSACNMKEHIKPHTVQWLGISCIMQSAIHWLQSYCITVTSAINQPLAVGGAWLTGPGPSNAMKLFWGKCYFVLGDQILLFRCPEQRRFPIYCPFISPPTHWWLTDPVCYFFVCLML